MSRKRSRVPGMSKAQTINRELEQRMMNRGAGGALAGLRREQDQRHKEGRPMSRLEVFEREQEIVKRAEQAYRARTAHLTGDTVELDEGFTL